MIQGYWIFKITIIIDFTGNINLYPELQFFISLVIIYDKVFHKFVISLSVIVHNE